jgi:hypothetical protein
VLALALVAWALFVAVRPATPKDLTSVTGVIRQIVSTPADGGAHHRVVLQVRGRQEQPILIMHGPGEPTFKPGTVLSVGDKLEATVTGMGTVYELRRGGDVILRDEDAYASYRWRTFIPGLLGTILTFAAIVLAVLSHYWRDLRVHFRPITA